MVDFRKLITPLAQKELAQQNAELLRFKALDPKSMAAELIGFSRVMIDSGLFSQDRRYSYDEWALYSVIPDLARAIDKTIVLRPEEGSNDEPDRRHPSGAPLDSQIHSILRNGSFGRADLHANKTSRARIIGDMPRQQQNEVRHAHAMLTDRNTNAITIGAKTVFPGLFPDVSEVDQREPLEGLYLISDSANGDQKVIQYCDDHTIAGLYFETATALLKGEEPRDGSERMTSHIRSHLGRRNAAGISTQELFGKNGIVSVSLQNFSGIEVRSFSIEEGKDIRIEDDGMSL